MPRWNRVIAAKCTVTQLPFTKRPTPAPTSDHSNVHGLLPSSRVSLHLSRFLVLSPSPQIPMGSLIADRQYSILLSSLPLQLRRPYALHRLLYVVALCRTTMRIRTTSNVSIDYGMDASAYTICSCSSQWDVWSFVLKIGPFRNRDFAAFKCKRNIMPCYKIGWRDIISHDWVSRKKVTKVNIKTTK